MAAGDPVADLELTDRGVELSKIVVTDGEHAQVELELVSTHDDSVVVGIEDPLPEGTTPTQIGFLPDNEPDDAQVTDHGTFRLDAALDPWVVGSIIYGIKHVGDVEALAGEPQVVVVDESDRQGATGETGDVASEDTAETTGQTADDESASGRRATPGAVDGLTIDRYEDLVPPERTGPGGNASLDLPLDEKTARMLAAQLEEHMKLGGQAEEFETRVAALEETAAELETQLAAVQETIDELEAWREAVANASRQDW